MLHGAVRGRRDDRPGQSGVAHKLFTRISCFQPDTTDYYGTGITLQVLIILSGNFVAP